MKKCTSCLIEKVSTEFYIRYSQCKTCIRTKVREYQKKNSTEISRKRFVKYRTPEGLRKSRDRDWRRRYGVSYADVLNKLVDQDGKCAACESFLDFGKNTHIDHDHLTKLLRGILCVHCNLVLGHCKDHTTRLKCLIEYLEVFK